MKRKSELRILVFAFLAISLLSFASPFDAENSPVISITLPDVSTSNYAPQTGTLTPSDSVFPANDSAIPEQGSETGTTTSTSTSTGEDIQSEIEDVSTETSLTSSDVSVSGDDFNKFLDSIYMPDMLGKSRDVYDHNFNSLPAELLPSSSMKKFFDPQWKSDLYNLQKKLLQAEKEFGNAAGKSKDGLNGSSWKPEIDGAERVKMLKQQLKEAWFEYAKCQNVIESNTILFNHKVEKLSNERILLKEQVSKYLSGGSSEDKKRADELTIKIASIESGMEKCQQIVSKGTNYLNLFDCTVMPYKVPDDKNSLLPDLAVESLKETIKLKYGIEIININDKWKKENLENLDKILADLPTSFTEKTRSIMLEIKTGSPGRIAYAPIGISDIHIFQMTFMSEYFKQTMVHEMTHCFKNNNPKLLTDWETSFWKKDIPLKPSVSDYGNSSPSEDMAESTAEYVINGSAMKADQPERYEFIKKNIMSGREY
ncbi:MAG: hypothetical protein HQM10_16780 [Candidatus Riflebacteria bacterium]|nr:hypothetical protein [Candidatus Riflebacteria bacterium]